MKILLTGSGSLAEAYVKINPQAKIYSFRQMSDDEIEDSVCTASVLIHNSAARWDSDPGKTKDSNFGLTKRIVNLVLYVNPKIKFINIGSMSYLTQWGYLPVSKMTQYAFYKFLSEIYCIMNLPNVISVRFSTLFYKDFNRDGLSKLIYDAVFKKEICLFNGGTAKRDFIPINIAVQYLDYIIHKKTFQIINICSGIETSFLQVGKIISKYTNVEPIFGNDEISEVLCKFIRELPEIKFSLENEMNDYIKILRLE